MPSILSDPKDAEKQGRRGKDARQCGMASLLAKQLVAMAASEGKDAIIECVPEQLATRVIAETHGSRKVGESSGLDIYRRNRNA